ncbi:transcriptional repressor [Deltaproteobacteria bacterium TL4]
MKEKEFPPVSRERGINNTSARLAILHYLVNKAGPASAQEIIVALKEESETNEVMVYRILEDFVTNQIASKVENMGKRRLYEVHHMRNCELDQVYFSCRICGKEHAQKPLGTSKISSCAGGLKINHEKHEINDFLINELGLVTFSATNCRGEPVCSP